MEDQAASLAAALAANSRWTCHSYICVPRPPNVPLLRALWSLLDGIWGVLKGSRGLLVYDVFVYVCGFLLGGSLSTDQRLLYHLKHAPPTIHCKRRNLTTNSRNLEELRSRNPNMPLHQPSSMLLVAHGGSVLECEWGVRVRTCRATGLEWVSGFGRHDFSRSDSTTRPRSQSAQYVEG